MPERAAHPDLDAFCEASVADPRRAARMLAATPALARSGFAAAVVLGDAERVARDLRQDPGLATRHDPRTGWTALHGACASRWHQLEPARADGLLAVARALLDAGADPIGRTLPRRGRGTRWRPLCCAIAVSNSGPSNRPVVELLLEHGAVPDDHDLYLAGFAHDRHQLLPLLLAHVPDVAAIAEQALAAPVSAGDTRTARLLLDAGADPRRYRDDDGRPTSIAWAAVRAGCSAEFLESILAHGADPEGIGPDGRTPFQLATAAGKSELADVLRRHGAADTASPIDRFLLACRRAEGAEARRLLGDDPGLLDRMSDQDRAGIVAAAEAGDTAAVGLMLDLGFPVETRGEHGATPLHGTAYAGSPETVRLLLDHGADIDARDATWDSTPIGWACVGSGERPTTAPGADWMETVRILLERGASTDGITLDPDDPKPPSPEVAELLRAHLDQAPRS
jgi:ankyrin repeat protein